MSMVEKSFPVSWDQFHRDARALAWRLAGIGTEWRAIVCITRGGLVPAAVISRELGIRLIETVCVASYHEYSEQGELRVLKEISPELLTDDGEGVLIVDDLTDTGKTAGVVRAMLPKAHFAAVYAKPKGRPMVDTFITEVSQDTWIFFPGISACPSRRRSARDSRAERRAGWPNEVPAGSATGGRDVSRGESPAIAEPGNSTWSATFPGHRPLAASPD